MVELHPYLWCGDCDRGSHRHGGFFQLAVPTNWCQQNRALVEKISYIRESIFGNMWDFGVDVDMTDTAYSNLALKAHTDGCFLRDPPGYQCVS